MIDVEESQVEYNNNIQDDMKTDITKNERVEEYTKEQGYKILGKIIIVLGIIGGIVIGNICGIPKMSGYRATYEFNYYLMIASWISSIILGSLFLALGEIVIQLTTIKELLLKNKIEK